MARHLSGRWTALALAIALALAVVLGRPNPVAAVAPSVDPLPAARFALTPPSATGLPDPSTVLPLDVTAESDAGALSAAIPDTRTAVADATLAPFKYVAILENAFGSSFIQCTGTIVAPNAVLTAAHCLYQNGGPTSQVLVAPAAKGTTFPLGVGSGTTVLVPEDWTRTAGVVGAKQITNGALDYGLVILNGSPFSALAPFPALAAEPDAFFTGPTPLLTAGYPGDKPEGTMWSSTTDSAGPTITATNKSMQFGKSALIASLFVAPGQSGSPVFGTVAGKTAIVAVLVGGGDSGAIMHRVAPQTLSTLTDWCGHTCSPTTLDDTPAAAAPHIKSFFLCSDVPICTANGSIILGYSFHLTFSFDAPVRHLVVEMNHTEPVGPNFYWSDSTFLGPFYTDPGPPSSAPDYDFLVWVGDTLVGSYRYTPKAFHPTFHAVIAPIRRD